MPLPIPIVVAGEATLDPPPVVGDAMPVVIVLDTTGPEVDPPAVVMPVVLMDAELGTGVALLLPTAVVELAGEDLTEAELEVATDIVLLAEDKGSAELVPVAVGPGVVLIYGLTVGQGIEVTPTLGVMIGLPIKSC